MDRDSGEVRLVVLQVTTHLYLSRKRILVSQKL